LHNGAITAFAAEARAARRARRRAGSASLIRALSAATGTGLKAAPSGTHRENANAAARYPIDRMTATCLDVKPVDWTDARRPVTGSYRLAAPKTPAESCR